MKKWRLKYDGTGQAGGWEVMGKSLRGKEVLRLSCGELEQGSSHKTGNKTGKIYCTPQLLAIFPSHYDLLNASFPDILAWKQITDKSV